MLLHWFEAMQALSVQPDLGPAGAETSKSEREREILRSIVTVLVRRVR